MTGRRTGLLAGGIVLLLVFIGWSTRAESDEKTDVQSAAIAQRSSIRSLISCTGRIVPDLEVEIKCEASGEVTAVHADVSDVVKKGMLLVELDPTDEQRSVEKAEASLAAARAQAALKENALDVAHRAVATDRARAEASLAAAQTQQKDARAKAERMRSLLAKTLASQEEYDSAESTAAQMDASLRSAQIGLEEIKTQELALEGKKQELVLTRAQITADEIALADARERLQETKIVAPIDGIVSSRSVEIGQIVSSGISNVGGGSTLMTVADLGRIFVEAAVDESDIGTVRVGQPAEITVDAYPGITFSGMVRRIATMGTSESNVVTFEVKIEVTDERKARLKPEMTANVEIVVDQSEDAIVVPASAVTRRRGGSFVSVVTPSGTEAREVQPGIRTDMTVEILSGLSEGDTVLVNASNGSSKWKRQEERRGPGLFGPPRPSRRSR